MRVTVPTAAACSAAARSAAARSAAAAAVFLLGVLPPAAHAASGPYLSVHGGPTYLQGEDVDLPGGGRIGPDYEFGYHLGGAVGHAFGPLRVEGEVGYQRNEVDGGDVRGGPGGAAALGALRGHATITSFMVNAFYDVDLGYQLRPFIGAGAGAAYVTLRHTATPAGGGPATRAEVADGDDTVPAVQALVGVSFDVDEHWTTAFSYRFFAAFGAEFDAPATAGGTAEGDFFSHALRFEARYRF